MSHLLGLEPFPNLGVLGILSFRLGPNLGFILYLKLGLSRPICLTIHFNLSIQVCLPSLIFSQIRKYLNLIFNLIWIFRLQFLISTLSYLTEQDLVKLQNKTFALSSLGSHKFRSSVLSIQRSFSLKFILGSCWVPKKFWAPKKCLVQCLMSLILALLLRVLVGFLMFLFL